MLTMAMAEAGYPDCHAYPSGIAYQVDPDNSVCLADPGGFTTGSQRSAAWRRGWRLVREQLDLRG